MNELKIFENKEFGQVRTVTINEEPWLVGKDVAEALGYERPSDAIKIHVDIDDKLIRCFTDSGQGRNMIVINESGLYALIFGSKLESAKRFKHWVTSEVLPSIRKTGTYQKPMSALDQIILAQKALLEVNDKVQAVDVDLQEFKQDMPLLGIEESKITTAVRRKGVKCLGGKVSEAYQDNSLRGKVYADIYRELKRQFGVGTYKAIKRGACERAIKIVEGYEPPLILAELIEDCNAQLRI